MTQVVKVVAESVVASAHVLNVSGNKAQVSFTAGKKSRTVHLVRKGNTWTDSRGWQWGFPAELTAAQ